MKKISHRRRLVVAAALTSTAAAGLVVANASSAGADDLLPEPVSYATTVFQETVKPWDSIRIPSAACDYGWLENTNYSPGRAVPSGVEIIEPGGVGVSIGSTQHYSWKLGTKTMHGVYGYDSSNGDATATNWDPFASHELTVVLHCTTDPTKASIYEAHRSILG